MTKIVRNVVLLALMGTYLAIPSFAQSCYDNCLNYYEPLYEACVAGCHGNGTCDTECYDAFAEAMYQCTYNCGY